MGGVLSSPKKLHFRLVEGHGVDNTSLSLAGRGEAKKVPKLKKILIGWEEWCALPDLGLPAVKAKIDTGAKTSALHAENIEVFNRGGQDFVRFEIPPLKKKEDLVVTCEAPLADERAVISSNGEREKRFVINTQIEFAGKIFNAEVTLTSRHKMTFRMLLGRDALKKAQVAVDPAKSFVLGKPPGVVKLYKNVLKEE
ncbi:MAG: hypothetical protein DHS20C02_08530 [Micavibrio sp.]|nr:MAG: hypothetical protein DHS20C02_08530 [Micavibrio sp.]